MLNLKRKIEDNVYIIAEMSANHAGKLENAFKIIEGAAVAGADCVKVQTYTADTLTIDCDKEPYQIKDGLWKGYTLYNLYKEAYTPWEWQKELKEKCEDLGMDFLATPFDKSAVDFLESIHTEFYKVASFELVDIPLIEYIASKHKPVILSCGMGSEEEITEAIDACERNENDDIILLKCCSQYPAKYEELNLSIIPDMKKRFRKTVGLSDHSFGSVAPIMAVAYGAKVIEKHVCLSRQQESPDAGFSMEMDEFARMVEDVHNASKAIGNNTYKLTENEKKSLIGRRSLVATKAIKKGDLFSPNNIRSIRPAIGIKPKYYNMLIGKKSKQDYEFGAPIEITEID